MDISGDPRLMARQGDLFGKGSPSSGQPASGSGRDTRRFAAPPHIARAVEQHGPGTRFPEVFGDFGSGSQAEVPGREAEKLHLKGPEDIIALLQHQPRLHRAEIEAIVQVANDPSHRKALPSPYSEMDQVVIAPKGPVYGEPARSQERMLRELQEGKDGFQRGPLLPPDQLAALRHVDGLAGFVAVLRTLGIPSVSTVTVSPRDPLDVTWQIYFKTLR